MRRATWMVWLGWMALTAACATGPDDGGSTGARGGAIYQGAADTTDPSPVAAIYVDQVGSCTGTFVASTPGYLTVLTAAHCAVTHDTLGNPTKTKVPASSVRVLVGTDWTATQDAYFVSEIAVHPSWSPSTLAYDFALLRVPYQGMPPPLVPVMGAAEDALGPGDALEAYGYGITDTNPGNTVRNHATLGLTFADATRLYFYPQDNPSGLCPGDSGGPAIWGAGPSARVAGVASYSLQPGCHQGGVSGRVSAVAGSFVTPFVAGAPAVQSCVDCSYANVAPSGACQSAWQGCLNDAACVDYLTCTDPCTTSACVTACVQQHPQGYVVYAGYSSCFCKTGCATECQTQCAAPACGFDFSGSSGASCGQCVTNQCCAEDAACYDDPVCSACILTGGALPECSTNPARLALDACTKTQCKGPCLGIQCGLDGSASCKSCFEGARCAQMSACAGDPGCTTCMGEAGLSPACAAQPLVVAARACLSVACSGACGVGSACGLPGKSTACETCWENVCCGDVAACAADATCTACAKGTMSGAACVGNAAFAALDACNQGTCKDACTGGGAGGAGGSGGFGGSGTAGSGTAGSGTAGSGTAGSGTAGSGTAGAGATAGAGNAGAGNAGAGNAGAGNAGAGPGGAAGKAGATGGAGGAAGSGVSGTGGSPGGAGPKAGAAGSKSGAAGSKSGAAGGASPPSGTATEDDGGCGCEVGPGPREQAGWLALGLVGLLARRRRS